MPTGLSSFLEPHLFQPTHVVFYMQDIGLQLNTFHLHVSSEVQLPQFSTIDQYRFSQCNHWDVSGSCPKVLVT